jgi:hypothetical protein
MVEVIHILHTDPTVLATVPGGYTGNTKMSAKVEIHAMERVRNGYSSFIRVYGEMRIAARECVLASELKLSTINMLMLTPESAAGAGTAGTLSSKAFIKQKGQFDNWASIDIYNDAGTYIIAGNAAALDNGSVWLQFMALGE